MSVSSQEVRVGARVQFVDWRNPSRRFTGVVTATDESNQRPGCVRVQRDNFVGGSRVCLSEIVEVLESDSESNLDDSDVVSVCVTKESVSTGEIIKTLAKREHG